MRINKSAAAALFCCCAIMGGGTPAVAQDDRDTVERPDRPTAAKVRPQETQADGRKGELQYTLGPEDVIEITVQKHPEFSGIFPVSMEGMIQYRFIGDLIVEGMSKKELEAKVTNLISALVVDPQVSVTVLEYRSKVIYVLGEVMRPGKYYIRSENIPVREAVVEAGLPTIGAALRRCRIISPDVRGQPGTQYVDLYSVLYYGDLSKNVVMKPGQVLYVPSTVMAKVFKVIAPITAPIESAADAQTGITTLNTSPSVSDSTRVRY